MSESMAFDEDAAGVSAVALERAARAGEDLAVRGRRGYRLAKRAMDVALASAGIVLLAPVIALVCLAIKIDSPGPLLYRQRRVGIGRSRFEILKFRKMRADLPRQGSMLTRRGDARMTRVGVWLERTKLDEIPQLLNVLRGEMSVVGPRPEVPQFVECYPARWDVVLSVKPGVFGLGQNHFRNEAELYPEDEDDRESFYVSEILPVMLDLEQGYVRTASLRRDIVILVRGIAVVLFR